MQPWPQAALQHRHDNVLKLLAHVPDVRDLEGLLHGSPNTHD